MTYIRGHLNFERATVLTLKASWWHALDFCAIGRHVTLQALARPPKVDFGKNLEKTDDDSAKIFDR
jgi:hypothetical protein